MMAIQLLPVLSTSSVSAVSGAIPLRQVGALSSLASGESLRRAEAPEEGWGVVVFQGVCGGGCENRVCACSACRRQARHAPCAGTQRSARMSGWGERRPVDKGKDVEVVEQHDDQDQGKLLFAARQCPAPPVPVLVCQHPPGLSIPSHLPCPSPPYLACRTHTGRGRAGRLRAAPSKTGSCNKTLCAERHTGDAESGRSARAHRFHGDGVCWPASRASSPLPARRPCASSPFPSGVTTLLPRTLLLVLVRVRG